LYLKTENTTLQLIQLSNRRPAELFSAIDCWAHKLGAIKSNPDCTGAFIHRIGHANGGLELANLFGQHPLAIS